MDPLEQNSQPTSASTPVETLAVPKPKSEGALPKVKKKAQISDSQLSALVGKAAELAGSGKLADAVAVMDFAVKLCGESFSEPLAERLSSELGREIPEGRSILADTAKWLFRYRLLDLLNPEAAKEFSADAQINAARVLPNAQELAAASSIADVDSLLRRALLSYSTAPSSELPAVEQVVTVLKTKIRGFSSAEIAEYSKSAAEAISEAVNKNSAEFSRRLNLRLLGYRSLNSLLTRKPSREESAWRELGKFLERKDNAHYFEGQDGKQWKMAAVTAPRDLSSLVSLVRTDDPGCFLTLKAGSVLKLAKAGALDARLATASEDRVSELSAERVEMLSKRDLSESGTLVITVFPKSYDRTTAGMAVGALCLERAIAERYSSAEGHTLIISDNPLPELKSVIDGAIDEYGEKLKDVVISFVAHGTEAGLGYRLPVNANALASLQRGSEGRNLHVLTPACHGAGLRDGILAELKKSPELAEHISVYLQTKPDVTNILPLTGAEDFSVLEGGTGATLQQWLLINSVIDESTESFGRAHHRSDIETKDVIKFDSEGVAGGEYLSQLQRSPEPSRS